MTIINGFTRLNKYSIVLNIITVSNQINILYVHIIYDNNKYLY
jgi:hypothetical protein